MNIFYHFIPNFGTMAIPSCGFELLMKQIDFFSFKYPKHFIDFN